MINGLFLSITHISQGFFRYSAGKEKVKILIQPTGDSNKYIKTNRPLEIPSSFF